ncbi:hypothetical protein [Nocardia xishanensis]|uniref:hypothetical protein n=1 Tax=Nocardia xishanensis TaxID=238964 RepID=UPI00082C5D6C|nr:hypothetical protein [Nocardia xishanensis]
MNHNTKARYAELELQHRPQLVDGLRRTGMSYREIARTLEISARKVEAVLGEAAALRASGHSHAEIGQIVGLPRTTVQDMLREPKRASLTGRKTAAVAALVEMHGMQIDVLAHFLDTGRNHTYVLVAELERAKLVRPLQQVQPGAKWVVPTRDTAARYLGWRPKDWTPPLMYANHYRAVAQARIMLVGSDPARWISERRLRHDAEQAVRDGVVSTGRAPLAGRPHVHDGRFLRHTRDGRQWWAVEVELTRKTREAMDLALRGAIRAARDAEPDPCLGVLYLCRSAAVIDGVHAAADRLPAEFVSLDMDLVVQDFDDQWTEFLAGLNAKKAAQTARRGLHVTRKAS